MSKTNRPIKGDGVLRKHRDRQQKRNYWKRERQAYKLSIKKQEESADAIKLSGLPILSP
jgi:hypothetical protein